jgi:methylase of polypeptide subunit release factors
LLLGLVTGRARTDVLAHPERDVPAEQEEAFRGLVARRAAAEPVAYLLGEREFYGRMFKVDRRALIPRPETELLVDLGRAAVARWRAQGIEPKVVDVGTGCGAIAISLAAEAHITVIATDLSRDALMLTRENAEFHGLAPSSADITTGASVHPQALRHHQGVQGHNAAVPPVGGPPDEAQPQGTQPQEAQAQGVQRQGVQPQGVQRQGVQPQGVQDRSGVDARHVVHVVQTDLLAGLRGPLQVVLANLPYIPNDRHLPSEVKDYEPNLALFGGMQGTELLQKFLNETRALLAPGAEVCVELDEEEQASPVAAVARELYVGADVTVCQDAGGYDRVVRILLT